MEKIDKTNFMDVPKQFLNEWEDRIPTLNIKYLFNADLIHFALTFKKEGVDNDDLNEAYGNYCKFYGFSLPPKELLKKFGDYTDEDLNVLMKEMKI